MNPQARPPQAMGEATSLPMRILVCTGSGGLVAGAGEVLEAFRRELGRTSLNAEVGPRGCRCEVIGVGCLGYCGLDVLVEVYRGDEHTTYHHVRPSYVPRIVNEHLLEGRPIAEWLVGKDYAAYHAAQVKLLLSECGEVDPERLEGSLARGGYTVIARVLREKTPEDVISVVKASLLRGRGGGGFPTWLKWDLARKASSDLKYIICNADEGDPGAFMDRALLEGAPHLIIEGMLIGAYAIGSREGVVYVRAEYPLAYDRLKRAIFQARERGFLGERLFGTPFSFDLKIRLGAGAFVCGEETALIASLEDRIGVPRPRPPYPVESGLRGKPTVINNVETWANVPGILRDDGLRFSSIGSETSRGTKIFSLVGKIERTGLVEVPMGMPLRQIIYDIGGGIRGGKQLKAIQTGGPSGGCLPASLVDTPVDYEHLTALGSIMGSGGMVVMDEDTCMVDVARYFLEFCQEESCGQCTPCREGTAQLVGLLEDICEGRGTPEHLALLEELAATLTKGSLCGLGKTASNPVLSTLKYFREEYEAHIHDRRCPGGVCKALLTFTIDAKACTGCTLCASSCAFAAIDGEKKGPHGINKERCTRCGVCYDVCTFGAVHRA